MFNGHLTNERWGSSEMNGNWVGPIPWPQFLRQHQFQIHSIIPTGTCPYASSEKMVTIPMHGPWSDSREKMTQFSRPSLLPQTWKTPSMEKKTQLTIHLWKARPQFKCFYTILYCVYYWLFCWSSAGRGESEDFNCRRAWSITSGFVISIPGFWTPAPTYYCWFRISQECR